MNSSNPLNDLRDLFTQLPAADQHSVEEVKAELDLNDSFASDGLGHILPWLAGWQESARPSITQTHLCLLASSYKDADNVQDVLSFIDNASKGKTALNHLCKDRGVGLRVLEMAPTIPHVVGADWSESACMAATAFGMEAAAAGGDLLGLSAIAPGSRAVSVGVIDKIKSSVNGGDEGDALDVMRVNGGREISGLVGAILAGRSRRLPILIEGWAAIAALYITHSLSPNAIAHVQVAAVECAEQYEAVIALGKKPIVGSYSDIEAGCGLAIAVSTIGTLINLLK